MSDTTFFPARRHDAWRAQPATHSAPTVSRRTAEGWRVDANAGGSVLLAPTATREQLLELRAVLDAALAGEVRR